MKTKHLCILGLVFFVTSYLLFSKVLPDFQAPVDFAHWFNLIGACLLLSFNNMFPKNRLNSVASVLTAFGVVLMSDFVLSILSCGVMETMKLQDLY